MKIEKVYVEFGGDLSDDKECYKRYCSTEPFDTSFPNAEVITFVAEWKVKELIEAAYNFEAYTVHNRTCSNKVKQSECSCGLKKAREVFKDFGDLG